MLKKYLSDLAFMQVLNLLIKPIWILVIDRAVQNTLSLEVYGNYSALFSFSMMFFILLDLGLNGYNVTQVSRDTKKITQITGSIIGLKIFLMGVYALFAFTVASVLGYSSAEFGLLLFLCFLQIITSLNQYLRTIVSSLQRFKWDGVFMVLDRVLVILLCSVLLWGGVEGWGLTIERFIYAQLAGVILVLVVLVVFLRNYLKEVKISFSLRDVLPLLKKSWPFALLITLMGLFNYLDSVMLKTMIGDAEAGEYAMGYRLFYALLMFAQIFSGVLLPFFSKHMEDKDTIRAVASFTARFLLLVGFSVALVCTAYGSDIMEKLYSEKDTVEAASTFSILMFGFIGSALILVYGTLLTSALELKHLNIAAFVTLSINLILNLQLIPQYGSTGAAIATVVSQLLFGGICFIVSWLKFDFKITTINLMLQILGVCILWFIIIFGKQYTSSILVHTILIGFAILQVSYLFRLFKFSDIKMLLRK